MKHWSQRSIAYKKLQNTIDHYLYLEELEEKTNKAKPITEHGPKI